MSSCSAFLRAEFSAPVNSATSRKLAVHVALANPSSPLHPSIAERTRLAMVERTAAISPPRNPPSHPLIVTAARKNGVTVGSRFGQVAHVAAVATATDRKAMPSLHKKECTPARMTDPSDRASASRANNLAAG